MTASTLNGLSAISVRLYIPWRGVWSAEVEVEVDDATVAQLLADSTVPAILQVGTTVFTGVIDPSGSGTFSSKTTVRVVGGRNGWGKQVSSKHFQSAAGAVISTLVYAATGAEVGEVATDPSPVFFGEHFARAQGPASDVFGNRNWFMQPQTSATIVGVWPTLPLDPDATILDFLPYEQRALVASENPILPGTVLIDPRFNGVSYTVRDVEQTFNKDGTIASLFCGDASSSRLADAFVAAARSAIAFRYLKTYKYRFAVQAGNLLVLQSVSPEAPDLNPIEQWGISGVVELLQPGTEIVVGFADGDPSQPYLVCYSPLAVPLQINMAASASISLTAPAIAFVGPATFGVPGTAQTLAFGPWATALKAALTTFAAAVAVATTAPQIATAGGTLSTALGALPPEATLLMKGN